MERWAGPTDVSAETLAKAGFPTCVDPFVLTSAAWGLFGPETRATGTSRSTFNLHLARLDDGAGAETSPDCVVMKQWFDPRASGVLEPGWAERRMAGSRYGSVSSLEEMRETGSAQRPHPFGPWDESEFPFRMSASFHP